MWDVHVVFADFCIKHFTLFYSHWLRHKKNFIRWVLLLNSILLILFPFQHFIVLSLLLPEVVKTLLLSVISVPYTAKDNENTQTYQVQVVILI